MPDLNYPSIKGGNRVMSDYIWTIIIHTPHLYYRHRHLDIGSCAIYTVSHNRTRAPEDCQKEHRNKAKWLRDTESFTQFLVQLLLCPPGLPIFCALSCSLHRHPYATQGHLHMHYPSNLSLVTVGLLPTRPPLAYFCHQHPTSHAHAILIHSLHVSKP